MGLFDLLGGAEEDALFAGQKHIQIVEAVADGDGLIADGLERTHGGELRVLDSQAEAVDHAVVPDGQLVAEERRPAELFHQRASKLGEGIADDDRLLGAAQLVQELLCPRKRVDLRDGLLDLLQAESLLPKDAKTPVHELGVVRFVPGGAPQLGNPADLRECDPDFRHQNAFQVKTNHIHKTRSPLSWDDNI